MKNQNNTQRSLLKRYVAIVLSVLIMCTSVISLFGCSNIEMTDISLDKAFIAVSAADTVKLNATVFPENASSALIWSSDNENVATVDEKGNVTVKDYGTAVITVSSQTAPDIKATCTVEFSNFYFVSTDGNDETGDGSESNPFRTIEKARDTIRGLNELPENGITVYIKGGEYALNETFTLTPEDSGTEDKPIIYAAYPGEEVEVVSKEYITGWKKLSDAEKSEDIFGMSDEAKENVYVADVPAGWRFHYLYADGVSQQNARMIESDEWESDWLKAKATSRDYGENGLKAKFDNDVLTGLDGWTDAEVRLITAVWWNVNAELADIDSEKKIAYIQSLMTEFYADFNSWGGQYNLMNTPKYLDVAGEWCVDSVNGKVYYWPAEGVDPNAASMFAPKLYELVRFQGDEEEDAWAEQVEYVTLRGINFLYSDRIPETKLDPEWITRNAESPDAMIYMQGVENCTVENCVIGYSGAQGIVLDHYAQNNSIIGNEIGQASSGGIYLVGYGPGTTDLNKNNYIAKNHIHNVGLEYMHSCAVQMFGSNNNTVEYNYFHDLPYAAVSIIGMAWTQMRDGINAIDTSNSFGGRQTMYNARWDEIDTSILKDYQDAHQYQNSENNTIQYNICDDYMQNLRDGGALYCWCSGPDKVWQFNVGSREFTDDWAVRAIHMDDLDGFNYVYKNLFHANGATDNSHTNGAAGGRGDGGKTDLNIWDDTVSHNTWKENIITPDAYPDGYLTLRAHINQTAENWLSKLPGAVVIHPDNIFSEALIHLDANDVKSEVGNDVKEWASKVNGYVAEQTTAESLPVLVDYKNYKALSFDGKDCLTVNEFASVNGNSGLTIVAVARADKGENNNVIGLDNISLETYQTSVKAAFDKNAVISEEREVEETGFTSMMFRKDGAKQTLFVDGKIFAEKEVSEKLSVEDNILKIGEGLNGDIAEIMIFGRAMSDEELETVNFYLKHKYFTIEDPVVSYELDESGEVNGVTLECETPGVTVYYTLDRSEPTENSIKYEGPISISETTIIRAVAVKDGWLNSRIVGKMVGVSANIPTENLLLHLSAEDAPMEVGSSVSELKSRVNDYVAVQSNSGSQPELIDCGGFYALKFDGSDMLIVNDFLSFEGHTDFSIVAVSRANEAAAGGDDWCNRQNLIMINETGGYGAIFVGSYQEDVRARIGIGTGNNFGTHVVIAKRDEPVTGFTSTIVVKEGKQQSVYADGELIFSENNGREKITNTDNTELRIGTGITGMVGDIAEILIYDSALNEEQIASINMYLEDKYFNSNN